jgi:hypothetical protein
MRWGLLVFGIVACRVADVDLTGKACPCPDGYTCNTATQTCAHSVTSDARIDGVTGDGSDAPRGACPTGVDICETFENGMLPLWMSGGSVAIDPTVAHRGSASLHAHLNALAVDVGGHATLTEVQTFATSAPFWVRAWVNIGALPAAGNHLEIMSAEQTQTPSLGDYVFFEADKVDVYSQFTDGIQGTATGAATNAWICLVWHVVPATSAGELVLTGDIATPLTYTGATDGTPKIAQIVIGLQFAGSNVTVAQPALDMWIDDIIINHAAVSCSD